MIKQIVREPLSHFLLAGTLLFIVFSFLEAAGDDPRKITITEEDLLVYLQGRARVYDHESFAEILDAMSDEEHQSLIKDVAIQEALHREGIAIGLPDGDPLIRLRTIQQMRLLLMEEAAASVSVSERDVAGYFEEHRDEYTVPKRISFTHVYQRQTDDGDAAKETAIELLGDLSRDAVPPTSSGRYGDRFLYQRNYATVTSAEVRSHFGQAFVAQLFAQHSGTWAGPLQSEHGWHLVYITEIDEAGMPELEAIVDRVRDDALAERREHAAREALNTLLNDYQIIHPSGVSR